ncbi:MFS transporter [Streptomyces sp. NPDC007872]|uniref:MFS transporter n=1 Tax=Streptomyces sp. NPDC007872 TaxID=3364782 RepID=UPI00367C55BC
MVPSAAAPQEATTLPRPTSPPASFTPTLARANVLRGGDALATVILTYALPLLVLTSTGSTTLTGLAFAAEWVLRLGALAGAGALADRYGAARLFRTANACRTLLTALAIPALITLPLGSAVAVTAVVLLGAACGGLAEWSFVSAETTGANLSRRAGSYAHRVQAWQMGIDQGAMLTGPLLGGLLLLAGAGAMLAAVAALSATALLVHPAPAPRPEPATTAATAGLRTGWRTLKALPGLGVLVAGLAASYFASGLLQASAPITVTHTFDRPPAAVGVIWSAAAAAMLAATALCRLLIDRFGLWPIGATAAALASAACLAAALAPTLPLYTAFTALLMAAQGVLGVVLRTIRARLIPAHVFAPTLSLTVLLTVAPMPAAGLLVAAVPAPLLPVLTVCCALVQTTALAWCFTSLRRHTASTSPGEARPPMTASPQPSCLSPAHRRGRCPTPAAGATSRPATEPTAPRLIQGHPTGARTVRAQPSHTRREHP